MAKNTEDQAVEPFRLNSEGLLRIRRKDLEDFDLKIRTTPFKDILLSTEDMEVSVHFGVAKKTANAVIVLNNGEEITTSKKSGKTERVVEWINQEVMDILEG